MKRNATTFAISALLAIAIPATANRQDPPKTIVETITGLEDHRTLSTLITQSGLSDTLNGPGPFTFLAPTDKAFEALPKSALELLGSDKELLAKVINYHVLNGSLRSPDWVNDATPATVQGETLHVTLKEGKILFNRATVITPDLAAKNGLVYTIDTVLIPPTLTERLGMPTIIDGKPGR